MDIYQSARSHGVSDADMRHAIEHHLYAAEIGSDTPAKLLYLGPDRAGNLLEIITIEPDDGAEIVIHAMKMRPQFADKLPEQDNRS